MPRISPFWFGLVSLQITACSSEQLVVPKPPMRGPVRIAAEELTRRDSLWLSYVNGVPGFGGLYYDDDGDLVVVLQDTSARFEALAASRFRNRIGQSHRPDFLPPTGHAPSLRFQRGQL